MLSISYLSITINLVYLVFTSINLDKYDEDGEGEGEGDGIYPEDQISGTIIY